MASELLHLDAANLFVGDDDPTAGKFIKLKSIKLPDLEEGTKEHLGGGAMATLVIGTRSFKVAPLTFKFEGFDFDTDRRFMPVGPRTIKYTIRGNVTNLRTHEELEIKAIITGRMTKSSKSDFERDKSIESDYEVNEITEYEVFYGGNEKLFFNYWMGPAGVRRDGVQLAPTLARNLGIA